MTPDLEDLEQRLRAVLHRAAVMNRRQFLVGMAAAIAVTALPDIEPP